MLRMGEPNIKNVREVQTYAVHFTHEIAHGKMKRRKA